jgi:hypothetical protein
MIRLDRADQITGDVTGIGRATWRAHAIFSSNIERKV